MKCLSIFSTMILALVVAVVVVGCGGTQQQQQQQQNRSDDSTVTPVFTLAWSEYPSWSVFGVADEAGLIDGRFGHQGSIEKKYGIDIVLKQADYDTCLTLFGSNSVDASCQTNIDSLAPSLGRASVIILPTSTSVGGDACIAVGFDDKEEPRAVAVLDYLKKHTTYGLEKSVSQYAFERNIALLGQHLGFKDLVMSDYKFSQMDPAAAATAMQTKQAKIESIMVWNPFVLQTLRTRPDAKTLFDSATIPEEIIDCIVVGKDSLNKKGGKEFSLAMIDTYFAVCNMMQDQKKGDATYVALGNKFCNLGAADMKLVCTQTRFYNNPTKGLALMQSPKFRDQTTPMITKFCVDHGMLKEEPKVGFNKTDANLNFDDSYLKEFQSRR